MIVCFMYVNMLFDMVGLRGLEFLRVINPEAYDIWSLLYV